MSFFTGEAQSFESFSFVSPFPKAQHVPRRSTASMAKVCVKRPLFCISGVSEQLHGQASMERISHTTHFHTGEGAKEEDTPQNPTKFRRFSGLMAQMVFLFAQGLLHKGTAETHFG